MLNGFAQVGCETISLILSPVTSPRSLIVISNAFWNTFTGSTGYLLILMIYESKYVVNFAFEFELIFITSNGGLTFPVFFGCVEEPFLFPVESSFFSFG